MTRARLLRLSAGFAAGAVLVVGAANAWVLLGAPRAGHDAARASRAQVALVLGAGLDPDGSPSAMLDDRLRAAAALFRDGRVERVLVSGDHGRSGYDEVNAMRRVLVREGVPDAYVFTDHAGFATLDSMVRAREVFGVRSAVVVTQGFHMARALWLGRRAGLEVTGLAADRSGYGRQGNLAKTREVLARVKAVADVATGASPRFLGPPVPVSGDAERSRG